MRAWLWFLAVAALGCGGGERTEVVIVVDSDLAVPGSLDGIHISILGPDGMTMKSSTANLGVGEPPLPRSLGVLHEQGPLGPFEAEVAGRLTGAVVVARVARFTFQRGRTLMLRVNLDASCVGVTCDVGETCAEGACRSADVDPSELVDWPGRVEARDSGMDGGERDAEVPSDGDLPDSCLAAAESCNGADDDCDGMVDENFDLTSDLANCGSCGVICGAGERCGVRSGGSMCVPEGSVVAVDGGQRHTCALRLSGEVMCWGDNSEGQLGDGTTSNSPTPVSVTTVSTATALAAGSDSSCAVLSDGERALWGTTGVVSSAMGRALPRALRRWFPGSPTRHRSISLLHACAVLSTGAVACWGSGRLGDGTTSDTAPPVRVSGIDDAVSVGTGWNHTCVVRSGGEVHCWGRNDSGQLGDGTEDTQVSPVAVMGISNAARVTAGREYSCATTAIGSVMCWGRNGSGQLGDGSNNERDTAVTAGSLRDAVDVRAGEEHTCALSGDGRITCWGQGDDGRLGDGTTDDSRDPVMIAGSAHVTLGLGRLHGCAAQDDGALHCWGHNDAAQLGDGTTTSRRVPTPVGGFP